VVDEHGEGLGLRHVHRGSGGFVVNIRAIQGRVVAHEDLGELRVEGDNEVKENENTHLKKNDT